MARRELESVADTGSQPPERQSSATSAPDLWKLQGDGVSIPVPPNGFREMRHPS